MKQAEDFEADRIAHPEDYGPDDPCRCPWCGRECCVGDEHCKPELPDDKDEEGEDA